MFSLGFLTFSSSTKSKRDDTEKLGRLEKPILRCGNCALFVARNDIVSGFCKYWRKVVSLNHICGKWKELEQNRGSKNSRNRGARGARGIREVREVREGREGRGSEDSGDSRGSGRR